MKESEFNVHLEINSEQEIVYNTFTGALVLLNKNENILNRINEEENIQ